jgi:NitT/TauT family transport system permease protein
LKQASAAAPILVILLVWQLAATIAGSPQLPSPETVLAVLWSEATHGPLLSDLGATLARVGICFCLAMAAGSVIGIGMASSPVFGRWSEPWLQTLLTMPAMAVAILCYIWLGLSETAAILAVTLSKLPNVVVILREGARSRDPELAEMARLFRFPRKNLILDVILPELAPYFLAATRSGLSLVWKIVLLVELLGRSSGIGFRLHVYFQLLDIARILAYALSFMAVIQLIEVTLLAWMDRHVARWKR